MMKPTCNNIKNLSRRLISGIILAAFLANSVFPPSIFAQNLFLLPAVGTLVKPTPNFTPPLLRGIKVHPEDPFKFDFIVDTGDVKLEGNALREESTKLIKYFLASLTVPEQELWVNLSPYEKDKVIPSHLGITEMGRDLLAQDYLLKQLTASLMYPKDDLGKEFWDKVFAKAQALYGTTNIPINTFNKVWIIPDKAGVYESKNTAYVVEAHLKVMLDEDFLALQNNEQNKDFGTDKLKSEDVKQLNNLASSIVKEVIIPAIEKEVNEGRNFTQLRQIYNALILATWFKRNLKETLLGKAYANKNKIAGVDLEDKTIKQKIYDQYVEAFKAGAYNYIKEGYDPYEKAVISRKYFSGGLRLEVEKIYTKIPTMPLPPIHDNAMITVNLKGVSGKEQMRIDGKQLARVMGQKQQPKTGNFDATMLSENPDAATAVREGNETKDAAAGAKGEESTTELAGLYDQLIGKRLDYGVRPGSVAKVKEPFYETLKSLFSEHGISEVDADRIAKTLIKMKNGSLEILYHVGMLTGYEKASLDGNHHDDFKNLSNEEKKTFALRFKRLIRTYTDEKLGSLEFQVGEFKEPMTPEALIMAIQTGAGVGVPAANTPIESLNKLLEDQGLYKVMAKRPNESRNLIVRLEQGQQLKPMEAKELNRLLIEANYPLETPKRQKLTEDQKANMMKRLVPLNIAGSLVKEYGMPLSVAYAVMFGHPNFPLWVKNANDKVEQYAIRVGGKGIAWQIANDHGIENMDSFVAAGEEVVSLIKNKVGGEGNAWIIVGQYGVTEINGVRKAILWVNEVSDEVSSNIEKVGGGSNAWGIYIAHGKEGGSKFIAAHENEAETILDHNPYLSRKAVWRSFLHHGRFVNESTRAMVKSGDVSTTDSATAGAADETKDAAIATWESIQKDTRDIQLVVGGSKRAAMVFNIDPTQDDFRDLTDQRNAVLESARARGLFIGEVMALNGDGQKEAIVAQNRSDLERIQAIYEAVLAGRKLEDSDFHRELGEIFDYTDIDTFIQNRRDDMVKRHDFTNLGFKPLGILHRNEGENGKVFINRYDVWLREGKMIVIPLRNNHGEMYLTENRLPWKPEYSKKVTMDDLKVDSATSVDIAKKSEMAQPLLRAGIIEDRGGDRYAFRNEFFEKLSYNANTAELNVDGQPSLTKIGEGTLNRTYLLEVEGKPFALRITQNPVSSNQLFESIKGFQLLEGDSPLIFGIGSLPVKDQPKKIFPILLLEYLDGKRLDKVWPWTANETVPVKKWLREKFVQRIGLHDFKPENLQLLDGRVRIIDAEGGRQFETEAEAIQAYLSDMRDDFSHKYIYWKITDSENVIEDFLKDELTRRQSEGPNAAAGVGMSDEQREGFYSRIFEVISLYQSGVPEFFNLHDIESLPDASKAWKSSNDVLHYLDVILARLRSYENRKEYKSKIDTNKNLSKLIGETINDLEAIIGDLAVGVDAPKDAAVGVGEIDAGMAVEPLYYSFDDLEIFIKLSSLTGISSDDLTSIIRGTTNKKQSKLSTIFEWAFYQLAQDRARDTFADKRISDLIESNSAEAKAQVAKLLAEKDIQFTPIAKKLIKLKQTINKSEDSFAPLMNELEQLVPEDRSILGRMIKFVHQDRTRKLSGYTHGIAKELIRGLFEGRDIKVQMQDISRLIKMVKVDLDEVLMKDHVVINGIFLQVMADMADEELRVLSAQHATELASGFEKVKNVLRTSASLQNEIVYFIKMATNTFGDAKYGFYYTREVVKEMVQMIMAPDFDQTSFANAFKDYQRLLDLRIVRPINPLFIGRADVIKNRALYEQGKLNNEKVTIVLAARGDYNMAFANLLRNIFRNHGIISDSKIVYYEWGDINELKEIVEKIQKTKTGMNVVFSSHSSQISLGSYDNLTPYADQVRLEHEPFLKSINFGNILETGGTLLLDGCEMGKGKSGKNNIATMFGRLTQDREVLVLSSPKKSGLFQIDVADGKIVDARYEGATVYRILPKKVTAVNPSGQLVKVDAESISSQRVSDSELQNMLSRGLQEKLNMLLDRVSKKENVLAIVRAENSSGQSTRVEVRNIIRYLARHMTWSNRQPLYVLDKGRFKRVGYDPAMENFDAKIKQPGFVEGGFVLLSDDEIDSIPNILLENATYIDPQLQQRINQPKNVEPLPLLKSTKAMQTVDAAVGVTPEEGGINLNPANINLNVTKEGNGVEMPADLPVNVETFSFDGLVPVIINIVPITDLPLFLGAGKEEEKTPELSLAR